MKARILIIEDVKDLGELVALYLGKEGMECLHVETAEAALERLGDWNPDLIILDINLPGMDRYEFLHHYRKVSQGPVLIVSARDADEDIIAGLGYGADELVTTTFSPRVLVARVPAILRRRQDAPIADDGNTIAFGPFSLDLDACLLRRGNERVSLSAREFDVLSYLAENPGRPIPPDELYAKVWKSAYGDVTAVAVYVQRLRKKIETDPSNPEYLETVFGMGYRFNPKGMNP